MKTNISNSNEIDFPVHLKSENSKEKKNEKKNKPIQYACLDRTVGKYINSTFLILFLMETNTLIYIS